MPAVRRLPCSVCSCWRSLCATAVQDRPSKRLTQDLLPTIKLSFPPYGRKKKFYMLKVHDSPHFALPQLAQAFSPALNVGTTTAQIRKHSRNNLVPATRHQLARLVEARVVQQSATRVSLVPITAVLDFVTDLPTTNHTRQLCLELQCLQASHQRLNHLANVPLVPATTATGYSHEAQQPLGLLPRGS